MGQWLRILKRLFVAHRGLPADQSDLPSLWRGLRESEDHSLLYWPTLLKGIVDSRNKLAHGGAADKSGLSQRLIDEFRTPLLDALYGPLHFLEDIAPVYIESVDFADDGSASNVNFVYELRWLTGDRIVSPCVRVPSNQRMRKGQTLAYSRSDDRAILIEPLAICSHCRECNRNELYFIDHFDFERPQWVSLGIGHKYPPKGGRSDWDDAVMELCRTL